MVPLGTHTLGIGNRHVLIPNDDLTVIGNKWV